jgi:hypothetical protein
MNSEESRVYGHSSVFVCAEVDNRVRELERAINEYVDLSETDPELAFDRLLVYVTDDPIRTDE